VGFNRASSLLKRTIPTEDEHRLVDSLSVCYIRESFLHSELVEIGGHLVDLSVEMVLDLLDEGSVLGEHKVDGGTLSTETTSTTDSVDVVLLLVGQLVVNDEADLLHIDTSSEEIGGDQDTDGTGTELLHDDVTTELVHLTVHDANGEIVLGHGLLEVLNPFLGVTVDEGLVDVQVGIQVKEHLHLPLFLLNSDVVLVDTFEGKLLVLDQNLCGVSHKVLGHGKDLRGEGGGEKSDLDVSGEELEDVLNLGLEATGQHLVSLVQNEQLKVLSLQESSLHHVVDTSGSADNDVGATRLELLDVILNDGTTDASLNLDLHVLANGVDDVRNLHGQLTGGGHNKCLAVVRDTALGVSVDALKHTNGESTSLTGTRLGLSDGVFALDERQDTLLLDGGGVLETITVDAAKHTLLKSHIVKLINFQFPVRFENLFNSFLLGNLTDATALRKVV